MLALFIGVLVFHFLVLAEIIPYNIVWGGRLENLSQMRLFESVSIVISLIVIFVVAIKGGFLRAFVPGKLVNFVLWTLVVLFVLNTIGNVFAMTSLEAIIATPVTLISAVFCYRMLIENQTESA